MKTKHPGKGPLNDAFGPGYRGLAPGKRTRTASLGGVRHVGEKPAGPDWSTFNDPSNLPSNTKPSHPTRPDPWRDPEDENEVNWNRQVKWTGLTDPFVVQPVLPSATCPPPPNTKIEQPLAHHRSEMPDPFDYSGKVLTNPLKMTGRQNKWQAYRDAAQYVQTKQEAAAPEINAYFHAEKSNELRALGFLRDTSKSTETLTSSAEYQQLPKRGGATVGSLFRSDHSLNTTRSDQRAIDSVRNAQERGQGTIERRFRGASAEDDRLVAAMKKVKAASAKVVSAKRGIEAAAAAIAHSKAQSQASEANAEIGRLQAEVDGAKQLFGLLGGISKLAGLADEGITKTGGVGTLIQMTGLGSVGSVATMILDVFPDERIQIAKAKLATAHATMKNKKADELQARLGKSKQAMSVAIALVEAAIAELRVGLSTRRDAYDDAAIEAGQVASGDSTSKAKIAGFIAAIPIVEHVVGKLNIIVDRTANPRPPYSAAAGVGYGIALYHQKWEAINLPNAIGSLEFCHMIFSELANDWGIRLQQLLAAKTRMSGERPGG